MNRSLFILTLLAALVLTLLTLGFPVLLWASFSQSVLGVWVLGAAALAVGLCKIAFFPIAQQLYSIGKKTLAVFVFMFGGASLVLSINATNGYLENITQTNITQKLNNDFEVGQLKTEINGLNLQIENLNKIITEAQKNNYRTQALNAQNELSIINELLNTKTQQYKTAVNSHTSATSANKNNSKGFGLPISENGFKSPWIISVSLHLGCVLTVMVLYNYRPIKTEINKQSNTQSERENSPEIITENNTEQPTENTAMIRIETPYPQEFNEEQITLTQRIIAGEFGNQFKMRNDLIEQKIIRGGHGKIKPVIDYLLNTNKIIKENRAYHLVQKVFEVA